MWSLKGPPQRTLRHGLIAMIGHDFSIVAVVPLEGPVPASRLSSKNWPTELVVIADDSALVDKGAAGFRVPVSSPEELSPIMYALPAQMLTHDLARLRGLNPDAPRDLSKVTETW